MPTYRIYETMCFLVCRAIDPIKKSTVLKFLFAVSTLKRLRLSDLDSTLSVEGPWFLSGPESMLSGVSKEVTRTKNEDVVV